jgi:hypothetical protein
MLLDFIERIAYKFRHSVFDVPLPAPTTKEMELVDELHAAFRQIPNGSPEAAPSAQACWSRNVARLRELVLSRNPREFLRWDVITRTMFVPLGRYIRQELAFLKSSSDWRPRWRSAIAESPVGRPVPYFFYPSSSANLIHHAYHLAQFEEKSSLPITGLDFVFEFGGGYGSMCRLFHRLGFTGRYLIYDLPAFSAIQRFYLGSLGLPLVPLESFLNSASGIACISEPGQLERVLQLLRPTASSLFLATWSLSETPLDVRSWLVPLLTTFRSFLLAFQDAFGEVDNLSFFRDFVQRSTHVRWRQWPIAHLPGNSYLVGC